MNMKEISDLGLVAGLVCLGYSPRERRKEGRRVIFVFENDDTLEGLCEDYFNNRMDVDAQKYFAAVRSVKASIYQMEDSHGN
jgi:hypothetical protein